MSRFMVAIPVVTMLVVSLVHGDWMHAACMQNFHASGTAILVSSHANIQEGTISGRAAPGGSFSGSYRQKVTGAGKKLDGIAVYDFGGGHSLTLSYHVEFDSKIGLYVGDYVIIGGSGQFENATGGGSLISERGSEVDFVQSGTLNR